MYDFEPTDESDPEDGFNYKQMMARDERRFRMADQDNDMNANKEEFTAFLHPEEYEHMKGIVVAVSDTLGQITSLIFLVFTAQPVFFFSVGNYGRY